MSEIILKEALLPGTALDRDVLTLARDGGGLLLPDLSRDRSRWLNLRMQVLSDHAQAFEALFYAEDYFPASSSASASCRISRR